MKTKSIITEVICFLFITLFVYAAGSKLHDVEKFKVQIGQSPILTQISGLVAWAIPLSEITISLLLAWTKSRLVGLFASLCLMMMFTAYIIAITQFSENIPCSCGGVLQSLGWTEHLIFNIIFVALAIAGIILENSKSSKELSPIHN